MWVPVPKGACIVVGCAMAIITNLSNENALGDGKIVTQKQPNLESFFNPLASMLRPSRPDQVEIVFLLPLSRHVGFRSSIFHLKGIERRWQSTSSSVQGVLLTLNRHSLPRWCRVIAFRRLFLQQKVSGDITSTTVAS